MILHVLYLLCVKFTGRLNTQKYSTHRDVLQSLISSKKLTQLRIHLQSIHMLEFTIRCIINKYLVLCLHIFIFLQFASWHRAKNNNKWLHRNVR